MRMHVVNDEDEDVELQWARRDSLRQYDEITVWYCFAAVNKMPYQIDELKKIGLGFIGFGVLFTILGVVLFFDKGLLALGNIFWLTGVVILLGWRSTLKLFTSSSNYKGSVSFLLGLFFLFVRWPVVGIILEVYGCFIIFSGFGPSIRVFLFQIPVVGWVARYVYPAA
ncbi:hypothetical protein Nepgr_021539 [Nepenthes gracilis]|uniref:Vesicle transport protein GOT1 n=1 Tax=Nepenthes gracilis TaxID=150966 RepID=A0AAD3SWZ7_NEPGR|nr:hypothetical protein Nepgr_021539 [Nepenthes gracilis]